MAAADKVDGAGGETRFPNGKMFEPVSQLMAIYDLERPANSYEKSFSKWREESEEAILALAAEGCEVDEASMDAACQIGYGVLEKFLKRGTSVGWGTFTVEERRANLDRLLSLPQIPQRTYEWYIQGKQVLTASEFSNIFGTPRAVRTLAFQKVMPAEMSGKLTNRLACPTTEMGPFDWGVRFEPVVKQVLSSRWGCKIVDTGRLMHPTDPLLAASPDGILYDAAEPARVGRLLEIKCPITRAVNGTIPFEYWCQMQIQMEVTGIDECEYVEAKIQSATAKGGAVPDMIPEGHVWLLYDAATEKMMYAYTEEEKASFQAQGCTELEIIPWRVEKLFIKTVVRDRGWFESTWGKRNEFWAIVGEARRGEIQPFEVKSKQKLTVNVMKEGVCYISDDVQGAEVAAAEAAAAQTAQAAAAQAAQAETSPIQPVLGIGAVLYTANPRSCMGVEQESGSPLL